ncbi:MAG: carbohydrate-binding domain-containing protein [Acutalibacteraceae bacterium]
MKKAKQLLSLILCAVLLVGALCACKNNNNDDNGSTTEAETVISSNEAVQNVLNQSVPEPDLTNAVKITLSDSNIKIAGSGAQEKDGSVTISDGGVYVISGRLSDGRVMVDADGKEVTLVMSGADITCSYSSPLYIYKSKTTTVYLTPGTENTLTDGESYTFNDSYSSAEEEEPNACFYSKSDLIIGGSGKLTVNANFNNGITSKDTLRIDSAVLNVSSKNHGVNGKDFCTLKGASVTVTSGGDALRSTNDTYTSLGYITAVNSTLELTSGEDGIQAETVLTMSGGSCKIKSGGGISGKISEGVSAKGLKGGSSVTILDGTYELDCCDDAIHSNGSAVISSGKFSIATGDDGMHADENLKITAGEIDITKSYEGLEGKTIDISGGTINIVASDDGMNAAGGNDQSGFGGRMERDNFGASSDCSITISGGVTNINASGDGIDSNGSLSISGGEVYISGPVSGGDSALDYGSSATVTGGTVIAAGSSGMAQNFSEDSTQGCILLTYQSYASGKISIEDSSGTALAEYTPSKEYNCVIISCPSLTKGNTYTVTACGQSQSVTLDSLIYGSGMNGEMKGGGMKGGRNQLQPPDGQEDPGSQGSQNGVPTPPGGKRSNQNMDQGDAAAGQSA